MARDIPESDWKLFRSLRERALERFCEQVLADLANAGSDDSKTHLDRYHEVKDLLRRRDRTLADVFDGPRRSTMVMQLALIARLGLLTTAEMEAISNETRRAVATINGVSPNAKPPA